MVAMLEFCRISPCTQRCTTGLYQYRTCTLYLSPPYCTPHHPLRPTGGSSSGSGAPNAGRSRFLAPAGGTSDTADTDATQVGRERVIEGCYCRVAYTPRMCGGVGWGGVQIEWNPIINVFSKLFPEKSQKSEFFEFLRPVATECQFHFPVARI